MSAQVLRSATRPREGEPTAPPHRHLAQLGYVMRVIAVEAHGRHARAALDRDERHRVELGLD